MKKHILFLALLLTGCKVSQPELGVYARNENGKWKYIRPADEGCLTKTYDLKNNRYMENGVWHEIESDSIVLAR